MVGDTRSSLLLALALAATLGPFVSEAISREDLYPYNGIGSSSLEISADGQLISAQAKLNTPISFYETIHDTIYVNGNGVLSFIEPMSRFFNMPFPLDYPVIAPLYTHVDTRGSGSVYFGETDAPGVISKAVDTIHRVFTDSQDFHPSNVLLATWENVGYFDTKSDKVNTYQVAISSNGTHSYVEFLYPENGIQWIQADSHPGGLPDAKAQAGLVARGGKMHTLKGSGTDQIQNIDKWSNVNNPGQWIFRIGPVSDTEDIQTPDNVEDVSANNEIPSCLTGATSCHSKAECVDYSAGFCCHCKTGFFGNGKSCLQNDLPIRVTGKVSGFVNGQDFPPKDLQCYVQTQDGRTYTAMARLPEFIGSKSQLLSNLGGVLGWLFAKPLEKTQNGYEITGGVFNLTADVIFTNTSDKITIRSRYLGLDVFGQLKMETEIKGSLPNLADDARVEYDDHEELYTKIQPGTILSQSNRYYRIIGEPDGEHPFEQNIVINYNDCKYAPNDGEDDTVRLKFSRGLTSYEAREQIIRFAMNTKIAPLELEDPCIEGRAQCGDHSSCIVDGDAYKCVCNPGYQYLYEEDGSAHCVDVNECTAGTHACSPNALCWNNEGSHVCQCVEGFYGDGRTCERLPSCEDTDCGDYSECNMIEGTPQCSCAWGYEQTERGCYPIRPDTSNQHLTSQGQPTSTNCSDKPCSWYAHCDSDEAGITECICDEGYVGDGYNCEPENNEASSQDPIKQDTTNQNSTSQGEPSLTSCSDKRCSWYAHCDSDEAGITECICDEGYVGDGYYCEPENNDASTTQSPPSSTSSSTTEEPPLPTCILNECWCPSGWQFQGAACIPQNFESSTPTPNESQTESSSTTEPDGIEDLSARPLPVCLEETGSCICPWGYAFDPSRVICVPQPGFNHETMGPSGSQLSCNVVNICHPYAQCVFIPEEEGIYACQCSTGYEGDGFECRKTEVTCSDVDICDPNASCQLAEPAAPPTCICNPGYEGNGMTCTPIDECRSHAECGENQQCQYNQITFRYTCNCISGYNRVDDVCVVADCATDPAQCHLNAQCVTTSDGGYSCVCIPGFSGDGIRECISDHVGCNVINNCGRNAVCKYSQISASYACHCKPGYYGDGLICLPESSCKRDPALCSVDATCVPAGDNQFACVCNAGFTGDGVDCRIIPQHESNILLINQGSATLRLPFFPTLDNPGSPISVVWTQMAVALDIDCSEGRAYWSDIIGNQISSMTYNGSDPKVFVKNVGTPEGLAIDWVSRTAFWTDPSKGTLEVANLDTLKRKVLISEGLVNPRGIAAHPYRGKIFWSDWNRASPKLEWANEDGTQRGIFLQNEHVKLPNSLAIDWSTDELCWADAGTLTINCANIDTRAVRVIAKNLSYPFGLAISQNHYYWTDWKTQKIEIASKNSGERNKPLDIPPGGNDKLYGIVAVPDSCPRVSNVCQYNSGNCDANQLCLPDGQGGRTCACADNIYEPCTDEFQYR